MNTCDNCNIFYPHSKHAALGCNCFVPGKPAKRTMVHLGEFPLFSPQPPPKMFLGTNNPQTGPFTTRMASSDALATAVVRRWATSTGPRTRMTIASA